MLQVKELEIQIKKMKKLFVLVFVSLLCIGRGKIFLNSQELNILNESSQNENFQSVDFWSDYPSDKLAKMITDQMTDSELLAQTFMFGWAGAEPPELLYQWVSRGLGSVKVFGWNTDDIHLVAKSISSLQKSASQNRFKIPLFVATDQEGGSIRHVKGDTSITPGNMAIGAGGYPLDAWYSAYYINMEIKALGINMNFAPTVDLFTNHDSTIIGTRSFGEDPIKAGILGAAFASGSMAAGVIPTVKHFPGHGLTQKDSHFQIPKITEKINKLEEEDMDVFKTAIDNGADAVMVGHLIIKDLDKRYPASLSKKVIQGYLVEKYNYKGLIITDDLKMMAIRIHYNMNKAVLKAIDSGNDMVMVGLSYKKVEKLIKYIIKQVKKDRISERRINQSFQKIQVFKEKYNVTDNKIQGFNVEEINRKILNYKDKIAK